MSPPLEPAEPRLRAPDTAAPVTPASRREFLLRIARTTAYVAPAMYSVSLGALPAAAVSPPGGPGNSDLCRRQPHLPPCQRQDKQAPGTAPVWEQGPPTIENRPLDPSPRVPG